MVVPVRKRVRIYKSMALIGATLAVIDLARLFYMGVPQSEGLVKAWLRTIFLLTGGLVLIFGRKRLVDSNMERSVGLFGVACFLGAIARLTVLSPDLLQVTVIATVVTDLLFIVACAHAWKSAGELS